ncbi:MAG: lipoyl(octanoyl) transferase LipB [Oscillatoriales cyanobacterium SM2_2_1]|nr:lipoyl(octanoyl) transferase LipB [Oscillatoriales cyanobacterium SM2_2_1]
MRVCAVWLGDRPVPYRLAWQWQQEMVAARLEDPDLPDCLLLLEHPPVYTLGQGADPRFLHFEPDRPPAGTECLRIERGGEVTYHAPGQLVGYGILNLRFYQCDLHWYLRQLEAVVIGVLEDLGIPAHRQLGKTGVWYGDTKLAQMGIKVRRWVTMHGFSLNVTMDLGGFGAITPCGLTGVRCGQVTDYIPHGTIAQIRLLVAQKFADIFEVQVRLHDATMPPTQISSPA